MSAAKPGVVVISMATASDANQWNRRDRVFPYSIPRWVGMIDRALKPRKPAKGYPRPVFDPEADAQTPPTWHYGVGRGEGVAR